MGSTVHKLSNIEKKNINRAGIWTRATGWEARTLPLHAPTYKSKLIEKSQKLDPIQSDWNISIEQFNQCLRWGLWSVGKSMDSTFDQFDFRLVDNSTNQASTGFRSSCRQTDHNDQKKLEDSTQKKIWEKDFLGIVSNLCQNTYLAWRYKKT